MPLEPPVRVVRELTSRGYNADREAVTLLAGANDPSAAVELAVDAAPADALTLTADHVRAVLDDASPAADPSSETSPDGRAERGSASSSTAERDSADSSTADRSSPDNVAADGATPDRDSDDDSTDDGSAGRTADPEDDLPPRDPDASPAPPASTSSRANKSDNQHEKPPSPGETKGVVEGRGRPKSTASDAAKSAPNSGRAESGDAALRSVDVAGDITGDSTGTGEYSDFVAVFRDRYERLSKKLRGRVNHRPTDALRSMPGGSDAALVGMVNDVRSTASGHWLVELEDTNGVFPTLVMKDRDIAAHVDELLMDEVIAVEGSLSSDGGILFADDIHFPDIPRTHDPNTADRHVQAALISDVHVGSQEFAADEWTAFADWLHTDEAEAVEYLLVAGDMVEGVGVYPDQDEELDIVDIYDQYEAFAEYLKEVPGDLEVVMIPGNHDAVRLAEPQPAFDDELRDIMSAHDATITGNPSTITVEGVDVLMYHGVSIDEIIAENPSEDVSYDHPHRAMEHLLRKRHVAPQFGGRTRLAPEKRDHLVVDDVPDVFHTGHVHKLGVGGYHNVRLVNSGCWQHQTAFQKSVNIDPDVATAPILDLDTLDVTVRKF